MSIRPRARKRFVAGVLAALAVITAGACRSTTTSHAATSSSIVTGPTSTVPCVPPAGGRCAGPSPVEMWLVGSLMITPDGRTISGRFQCGGQLAAKESADQVVLTFTAGAVGPGALSCALVPLSFTLHSPLGNRTLLDGVTHQTLSVLGAPR